MTNNDILRSLRYALNTDNTTMKAIFKAADYDIEEPTLLAYMHREDEPGSMACSARVLGLFLDGLIIFKRGKREVVAAADAPAPSTGLSNNDVLKKVRIAFDLKGEDILQMLSSVGFSVTMSQINALFRKKGHKNYMECQDQLLRNFLKALSGPTTDVR